MEPSTSRGDSVMEKKESNKHMNNETWIQIKGWDKYEVSNLGQVRNSTTMRCLKPAIRSRYLYVVLCGANGARSKSTSVHRLVAEHHCPNPNGLEEVNHKDGNKLNNVAANLEWVSRTQNLLHSYDIGLRKKGEASHLCAKLDESKVREIRAMYCNGIPQHKIGNLFGVSQTAVGKIVNMKKWRHVI